MHASNRWACVASFRPTFHHFAEKLPRCAWRVGVRKALFHTASLWPFMGLSGGGVYPHFSKERTEARKCRVSQLESGRACFGCRFVSNESKVRADRSQRSPGR